MRWNNKRVLAVASGGGHWVQLMRLKSAFDDFDVAFVTVDERYRSDTASHRFYCINDASRWNRFGLMLMTGRLLAILLRERPDLIVTTGAAPGCLAIWLGHLLGCRTAWIDSIANVQHMSMSGEWVRKWADLWLTQWPHLASEGGPRYEGAVL